MEEVDWEITGSLRSSVRGLFLLLRNGSETVSVVCHLDFGAEFSVESEMPRLFSLR